MIVSIMFQLQESDVNLEEKVSTTTQLPLVNSSRVPSINRR